MSSALPDSQNQIKPQVILDMNYAFSKTALLVTAVRLHLFTVMQPQALTAAQIAERIGTQVKPTERLLAGLVSLELLERDGETYRLAPVANQFLVEGRPSYLGGDTLGMLDYIPAWFGLEKTLITSQPYRDLSQPAVAEEFFAPRVLDLYPLVYPVAKRTSERLTLAPYAGTTLRILDVAAGSAPWSVPFAQRYPDALVTAIDLPTVVESGKRQVAAVQLEERYTWIAADVESYAFPDQTYDLVVVGHLFRFIGEEHSLALLRHFYTAMNPGATLIVSDVFLNDDRLGPPAAINLNLSMLTNTAQGGIFSCQEVSEWLTSCGFLPGLRFADVGPFPVLVVQKPA